MVEKRKQDILEKLPELHESIEQLREAIEKGFEPVEELALDVVILQVEILKEQYGALQIARRIYNSGKENGTG